MRFSNFGIAGIGGGVIEKYAGDTWGATASFDYEGPAVDIDIGFHTFFSTDTLWDWSYTGKYYFAVPHEGGVPVSIHLNDTNGQTVHHGVDLTGIELWANPYDIAPGRKVHCWAAIYPVGTLDLILSTGFCTNDEMFAIWNSAYVMWGGVQGHECYKIGSAPAFSDLTIDWY